jgi:Raf kinase inhibitor-like YbhB/YbcL family protein
MREQQLNITSVDFTNGGWIPLKNTARGDDISPQLEIDGITEKAVTLAITMDDASHPIFPNYNHWIIWNLPIKSIIPAAIPHGKTIESLDGTVQGVAYGRNRYKGPKPPFKQIHTYVFTVYVLDCKLNLSARSKKADVIGAMRGHILQQATISGKYQSRS